MMNSLSSFDILAIVAEKEHDKQQRLTTTITMPMSEKKPLPFNLNFKPRTVRKPHSSPIDIHALLPCLHHKPKLTFRFRPPKLPLEYQRKIAELGGSDLKLVIQKRLRKSDVKTNKGGLVMPYRECQVDFGTIREMFVKVIQPANMLSEMILSFKSCHTKSSYVLTDSWNHLVQVNGLRVHDLVQVVWP
ncbi:hypothetical protein KSS87_011814 [Heliosperma pusillum]|nr:hypothetical protein KSS87_011814 [Heliosperma pusillum]